MNEMIIKCQHSNTIKQSDQFTKNTAIEVKMTENSAVQGKQCGARTFGPNQKQCYLEISAARGNAVQGLAIVGFASSHDPRAGV